MLRRTIPVALLALLATAGPALAQLPGQAPATEAAPAEAEAPRHATLSLEPPGGGTAREYQLDEINVSATRSLDGRGEMRVDVSVTLGSIRPLDDFLLEWARQGEVGAEAARRVSIAIAASPPPNAGPAARYEMEGARVTAFSASHSAAAGMTQVMLQLFVRRISLNGIILN